MVVGRKRLIDLVFRRISMAGRSEGGCSESWAAERPEREEAEAADVDSHGLLADLQSSPSSFHMHVFIISMFFSTVNTRIHENT